MYHLPAGVSHCKAQFSLHSPIKLLLTPKTVTCFLIPAENWGILNVNCKHN